MIGGDSLDVSARNADGELEELFSIPLVELRDAHERTLPSYAG